MGVPMAFGWRQVAFANWPVDAATIDPHVPEGLAVEEFDSTGWLSIVPLRNVATRPRWLPSHLGLTLPEINVRTYVRRGDSSGVYFFSLDAQSLLSVLGARVTHHLPYFYARVALDKDTDGMTVRSRRRHPGARPATFDGTVRTTGDAFTPTSGSLAAFLTERRRLITQDQSGRYRATDVRHPRWRLRRADLDCRANSLFAACGFDEPDSEPVVYYSSGLDVTTTRSKRLR